MPDPRPSDDRHADRSTAARAADHAAIDRLTGELLPSLVAKLGATGLGELEVREGDWRVRLRRPAGGSAPTAAAVGAGRERRPGDRARTERDADRASRPTTGSGAPGGDGASGRGGSRGIATSPAVGIYRPRPELSTGDRVRTGDRLGAVDMLGVAQEVLAPADGIVGATLVEAGDAVEYGQELVVIEIIAPSVAPSTNGTDG